MAASFRQQKDSTQSVAALQKEADRLKLLLNVTNILPWEADFPSSTFTYVGERAVDLLGYPRTIGIGLTSGPSISTPTIARGRWPNILSIQTADNYELEYRMIAKDGRVVWLNNVITVSREHGSPKTIRGFSIDITKSKQNETALRDLSGRLINAQEEERRRVARELHDDLNQRMALLSIELGQLAEIKEPSDLGRRLKGVQNQAREISADIHRLSYKLHPSKLDYLGLAPAIKSLCHEFCALGTLEVEFHQRNFPESLPNDVTLCLFRICQEALRNCARHSGAISARVTLGTTKDEICLAVADDGCGFDMESAAMKKGLGFTSMRERLRIVGGKMEVRSQRMHGTVIQVSIPMVREPDTVTV